MKPKAESKKSHLSNVGFNVPEPMLSLSAGCRLSLGPTIEQATEIAEEP
jgi:hypothetical protein